MDAIDRKILAELQRDGRLSLTELAKRVQLSVSPCHRRLRALEASGAIGGYHAVVDAAAAGLSFEAIVFVILGNTSRETVAAFERGVEALPHVVQAQRLFGEPDYILRVIARDVHAYQLIYDEQLTALPGVQTLRSTLVMKRLVEQRPLPL